MTAWTDEVQALAASYEADGMTSVGAQQRALQEQPSSRWLAPGIAEVLITIDTSSWDAVMADIATEQEALRQRQAPAPVANLDGLVGWVAEVQERCRACRNETHYVGCPVCRECGGTGWQVVPE